MFYIKFGYILIWDVSSFLIPNTVTFRARQLCVGGSRGAVCASKDVSSIPGLYPLDGGSISLSYETQNTSKHCQKSSESKSASADNNWFTGMLGARENFKSLWLYWTGNPQLLPGRT